MYKYSLKNNFKRSVIPRDLIQSSQHEQNAAHKLQNDSSNETDSV